MRHGIAVSEPGMSDRDRPLSTEGVTRTERAAAGLAAIGARFDRIFTSPLARAAQTAAIVARAQPATVEPEVLEALAGGVVPEALFRALGPLPDDARILLVGHEPDMGALTALLTGTPPAQGIPFRPGSIARVDVDRLPPKSAGRLIWLLTAPMAGDLAP